MQRDKINKTLNKENLIRAKEIMSKVLDENGKILSFSDIQKMIEKRCIEEGLIKS